MTRMPVLPPGIEDVPESAALEEMHASGPQHDDSVCVDPYPALGV
jgi:hypothetical protein